MATVELATTGRVAAGDRHPRCVIRHHELTNLAVELTATNPANDHRGLGPEFVSIDRAESFPLFVKKGDRLRESTLSGVIVGGPEVDSPGVEAALQILVAIVRLGEPVVIAFGPLEAGTWIVSNLDIRAVRRQPGTNAANWCEVELEIVEHKVDPIPPAPIPQLTPTPITSAPPAPVAPSTAAPPPGPRTHTIVRGDTLWDLAGRYYRDHYQWRRIADANGVRDPRKLVIGQRLTIP